MIIDRVRLSGLDAYLTDQGTVNLATSANRRGASRAVPDGLGIEMTGLRLILRASDLLALYARSEAGQGPLLTISIRKEMFPTFFADPYANRVHSIAGFEDFQRGASDKIRPMEVEGRATLVATGFGDCAWRSPVYHLPEPTRIHAAAWDLATSRLTPPDSFVYSLTLFTWSDGEDPASDPPATTRLAPPGGGAASTARPDEPRHCSGLDLSKVAAYQLQLKASVRYDTYLTEYQLGMKDDTSLGRPLLRAIHLLEPVETIYAIHSLGELEARCSDFSILETESPRRTLAAYVDLPALLMRNEEIALTVKAGIFTLCEARIEAELRAKPPAIERALEG